MKLIAVALLLAAPAALADKNPIAEQNARSFYNDAERRKWTPESMPVGDALSTMDVREDDEVRVRRFYLMPIVGGEISTAGGSFRRAPDGSVDGQLERGEVYGAPSFGALVGWRLGGFTLGARYQGSIFSDPELDRLMLNKVYGEIGFNARRGRAIFNGYLDLGWAFATNRTEGLRNGVGAKAGFGVDFLLTRFLSIGPALEFDVQAYRTDPDWVAVYGGSALLRLGIQL